MIAGVGLDIVDLVAFREQLADAASRFVEGTFTPNERREAASRPSHDAARHLAARFAAKEAFIKAWSSSGYGRSPRLASIDLREIEVVSDAYGRPTLALHGAVERASKREAPLSAVLSLSHDGGYAAAVVLLERSETGMSSSLP